MIGDLDYLDVWRNGSIRETRLTPATLARTDKEIEISLSVAGHGIASSLARVAGDQS